MEKIKFSDIGPFCEECGYPHYRDIPHNIISPIYRENFHKKHGRYPEWEDAIKDCSPEVQEVIRQLGSMFDTRADD